MCVLILPPSSRLPTSSDFPFIWLVSKQLSFYFYFINSSFSWILLLSQSKCILRFTSIFLFYRHVLIFCSLNTIPIFCVKTNLFIYPLSSLTLLLTRCHLFLSALTWKEHELDLACTPCICRNLISALLKGHIIILSSGKEIVYPLGFPLLKISHHSSLLECCVCREALFWGNVEQPAVSETRERPWSGGMDEHVFSVQVTDVQRCTEVFCTSASLLLCSSKYSPLSCPTWHH